MAQRYDVVQARERAGRDGETKTTWTRLGAAWPRDRGGYAIELDALPLPDAQGRVRLLLLEPRERGDQAGGASRNASIDRGRTTAAEREDGLLF